MTGITVGRLTGVLVGVAVGGGDTCAVAVGEGSGITVGVAVDGTCVSVGEGEGAEVAVAVDCGAGEVAVDAFRGAVCAHAANAVAPATASTSKKFRTFAPFNKSQLSQEALAR